MSTPGGGDGPRYDPYSQREQQGGQGQPGAYGSPPPYGSSPPYGSPPPYGQPGQYAYNPYSSSPYPAGLGEDDTKRAPRPGSMVLALVLSILSTLLFLLLGLALLVIPLDEATLAPILAQLPDQRIGSGQLVGVIRVVGGVFAAVSVLYIVLAVLAFTGRNWARIALTVLTVGFVLLLAAGLVGGGGTDGGTLGLTLAVLAAAVVGTVLLYQPAARRFFANPRR